jgi:hypothetical protein
MFLGTNIRKMMKCQGFLEWLLWQLMFDDFGDFELSVKCVSSLKEYMLHYGSFEGFGNERILENIIDYTHRSRHESLSSL